MRTCTRTTGTGVVPATTPLATGCSGGGGDCGPQARENRPERTVAAPESGAATAA
ncbi:hypothetical protein ACWGIB_26205 [Streptomyces xiamenensis]